MYLERTLSSRLMRLTRHFPAVVISGARQVGKSTLLHHHFCNLATIVVFDPVVDVSNARADPELFLDNHPPPLVLDEIQYAPELLPAIKRRIDQDRRPGQYIMTGSQQWGVLKSIAESLAGRAVFLDLAGFSLAEVAGEGRRQPWLEAFLIDADSFLAAPPPRLDLSTTLYERLWRGSLPEANQLPLDLLPDFQAGYLRTYIERDVRLLAEVSDWQLFGRFVRLLCALTAQEINFSQLGRELGISPNTANTWLGLLRATYQWFEVQPYSGNAIKRLSSRPKGYLADTGMACAGQAISSPRAIGGHPLMGALFETAVALEIRKQTLMMSPRPNLYHWRAHGGAEVDLLLERDGCFYPIEVKSSSRPSRRDTTGLRAFRQTYPGLRTGPGLVIAPTEAVLQLSEDDHALPWDLAPL